MNFTVEQINQNLHQHKFHPLINIVYKNTINKGKLVREYFKAQKVATSIKDQVSEDLSQEALKKLNLSDDLQGLLINKALSDNNLEIFKLFVNLKFNCQHLTPSNQLKILDSENLIKIFKRNFSDEFYNNTSDKACLWSFFQRFCDDNIPCVARKNLIIDSDWSNFEVHFKAENSKLLSVILESKNQHFVSKSGNSSSPYNLRSSDEPSYKRIKTEIKEECEYSIQNFDDQLFNNNMKPEYNPFKYNPFMGDTEDHN